MSIFKRTKCRGASYRLLGRNKPDDFFGGPDSIEITPYFEDNYGNFLDEEAQFMEETRLREAETVELYENQPFEGNADTRIADLSKEIYEDKELPNTTTLNNEDNNENTSIMSGASGSLISAGAGMMSEGAMNIAQSFGMKRKRAEQRAANREHYRMRQDYMSLDVEDPYRNLTNPYDNMTVNQQMAQFEAQQNQQALANTLGSLQGAAGASGIAGLAQVVANQQARNMQRASASIGLQEQSIGMARAATQARMQEQGAQLERKYKTEQAGTLYGIAQQRKSAADEAVEKARMGLAGGVLQTVQGAGMAVAGAVMGG